MEIRLTAFRNCFIKRFNLIPAIVFGRLFLLAICFSFCHASNSQAPVDSFPYNPAYYKSYEGFLAGRLFIGRKYTDLSMKSLGSNPTTIPYKSNSNITLGIGGTYNWLTLNLGFGFRFLNQHREENGETRYIDLQAHIYGRRSMVDLYALFYKGFYIDGKEIAGENNSYIRPDLKTTKMGFAYLFMPNWKRFSARASMLQSEQQLKSAGTPLVGLDMNYISCAADSSLVPHYNQFDQMQDVHIIRTLELGPSLGYAYTLVVMKRVFITGMLTGNLGMNLNTEHGPNGKNTNFALTPGYTYKLATGYTMPRWALAFTWANEQVRFQSNNYKNGMRTGNVRLSFVYKFVAGPKLLRTMKPIDDLYNKTYRHYMKIQNKILLRKKS